MNTLRRIGLFVLLNFLVISTIGTIMYVFDVQPYLTKQGLDLPSLLAFTAIWGMGGAFISLALSKVTTKWIMRVQTVDETTTDPRLRRVFQTVKQQAVRANLPATPEVGVFQSDVPNAFATGPMASHSLVAVSTGLLNTLNDEQIDAVIAHEITHIANGDMVTMTLLQGVINVFVMFTARVAAYAVSGLGKNRRSSYMTYFVLRLAFEIIFMLLGSLVIAAFSRFREYRADKGGARLTSKKQMIGALQTIHEAVPSRAKFTQDQQALQALMISPRPKMFDLFSTHPSLEKRIKNIESS